MKKDMSRTKISRIHCITSIEVDNDIYMMKSYTTLEVLSENDKRKMLMLKDMLSRIEVKYEEVQD